MNRGCGVRAITQVADRDACTWLRGRWGIGSKRVELLIVHPLDGQNRRRLSTALLVHRLRSVG